jgi:hypothetical protein
MIVELRDGMENAFQRDLRDHAGGITLMLAVVLSLASAIIVLAGLLTSAAPSDLPGEAGAADEEVATVR